MSDELDQWDNEGGGIPQTPDAPKRVFVRNSDSGEPLCYIADMVDVDSYLRDRDDTGMPLGLLDFVTNELDEAVKRGDKKLVLDFEIIPMTDEQVKSLPDV